MKDLATLADLIRQRNAIGKEITKIIGRPSQIGHLGEYIAAKIFDIGLEKSAVNKGFDGQFQSGPLAGKSVNIKWYAKYEGLLDIGVDAIPDFYLVLTGPPTKVLHSRGEDRPWLIDFAYLFDATLLLDCLQQKQLQICEATSVSKDLWSAAEVYPNARNPLLPLSVEQCSLLSLFSSPRAN